MNKKIFIWVAHPKRGSLCAAMADAYQKGAEANGSEVRRMDLCDMEFESTIEGYSEIKPDIGQDLLDWQEAILWADHIMFIHPYWWGAMPNRAKAVLDCALLPGFGFKYHKRGMAWDKLLDGKTGDAIITSDTPTLLDTVLYRKPARRVIKNQVFSFCGIKPKRIRQFGSVKLASENKILSWIAKTETMGMQAAV